MVPGVGLAGLVNDAFAAVGSVVPDTRLRVLLLQEGLAGRSGHPVFADHGALVVVVVRQEEELVVLCTDLAQRAAAAGSCGYFRGETQQAGVHKVCAFGQAAMQLAHAGLSKVVFVQIQCHSRGETAHRVAGHADNAVASFILQNIGLLVHIADCIVQGGGPEAEEAAGVLGIALGVAVVIHIQCQHHISPAGQFDGVGILHLCGVQVTMGDHDGGAGIAFRCAVRQVEQAAQYAFVGIKADAVDRDGVVGGVEHLCQDTADQDQREGDRCQ